MQLPTYPSRTLVRQLLPGRSCRKHIPADLLAARTQLLTKCLQTSHVIARAPVSRCTQTAVTRVFSAIYTAWRSRHKAISPSLCLMSAPGDILDPNAHILFEVGAAAIAFSVYDTIINIADEVEHIWRAPNSWVKWTYLFVRHFPYIAQVTIISLLGASHGGGDWTPESCRDMIAYQFTVMEVTTIAVEIILIMRVYVMFHSNKKLLAIILFLFLGEVASMLAVIGLSLPKLGFTPQCLIISTPSYFTSYWLISLTFETLLFILTLIKFFRTIRKNGSPGDFLTVLARDGTWAYAIIFVIMLLNTLMFDLIKNTLAGVCYFWELSVMSFAGSHMLLNIRRMAHKVDNPPTENDGVSANIDFTSNASAYVDSSGAMTEVDASDGHTIWLST